ncbi:MAG TPA: hypothetical protein VNH65_04665 [Candidatus Acidoferrum sp.]|nr:hypothetical protein [Candidatus Acidoferrum sp.]
MRRTNRKEAKPVRLRKQLEVIRDVMLSAGLCATWLTLDELAKLTHYPPASISAQLRHMRKPRFGAYEVVKRCRTVNKAMRAEGFGTVWEYSVLQEQRAGARRKRDRRRKSRIALQALSC